MKKDFESCGEHLRNLITPYCTLLEIIKDLKRYKEEGNDEMYNKILQFMMDHDCNNIDDIVEFSKIDQMENANWRESELFKSKTYNGYHPKTQFEQNVENVINNLSLENVSNTPDHILAKFVDRVFWAANNLIKDREVWYGSHNEPGKITMNLKDFVHNFSHNNAIFVENVNCYCMTYKYNDEDKVHDGLIMDWELLHTDIAECDVLKISNVIHPNGGHGITIVVDTDKKEFNFIPDLVTMDNSPVWLYEKVHKTKIEVADTKSILRN